VLRLQVWNEALETHFINSLSLLEVRHAPDEQVVPDEHGKPLAVGGFVGDPAIADRAGRDLRATLAHGDGDVFSTERGILRDASRGEMYDHIDVTLPRPTGDSAAVVVRMRNSLLNTVLFYDYMLARPGARSLDWMSEDLERIDRVVELGRWYAGRLGLVVSVRENGRYRPVARLADFGPIAFRDAGVVVPVPAGDSLRIRLGFIADQWRIDRLAVAARVRRPAVREIPLAAATGPDGRPEPAALRDLREADDRYLVTTPRQRFIASFDAGPPPVDSARTFLLVSQGYYTEWVRAS